MRKPNTEPFRKLQPGDPWTMILAAPVQHEDGRPAVAGDMMRKWFATNESGRLFRIIAIHGHTYETIFIGFEECRTQPV